MWNQHKSSQKMIYAKGKYYYEKSKANNKTRAIDHKNKRIG